jgi:hypothetical protein
MENAVKCEVIRPWINLEKRVTVDFLDEKNLDAIVMDCTHDYVALAIHMGFPYRMQHLTVPLAEVEVGGDRTKHATHLAKPLYYGLLQISLNIKRPQWVQTTLNLEMKDDVGCTR